MASSWMLRRLAHVKTDDSKEHGVTSHKTPFFIVAAVKPSNLTEQHKVSSMYNQEGPRS
jgi:hypothetical protein